MKGKFKILGHIGLVLFLVSALMLALMPVAKVEAATAVTNVWVQFTTSTYNKTNTASDFTIHFTPTTAMSRGVDTITVWFPDGSTDMGPDNFDLSSAVTTKTYYDVDPDGEVTTNSATDCTSAAVLSTSGYRITVTTPVNLTAGTACSLQIEAAAGVKCADSTSHTQYKIKVYTSKDTTPVLSDAFDIDATGINAVTVAVSPDTAGSAGQYTFSLDTTGTSDALGAGTDTVTFIFPYGTTIPSSISADQVSWSNDAGASWSTGTVVPTINQKARMITCTTPIALSVHATNNKVRFSTGANIRNPTTATSYTDCYVFTSKDELQVLETSGYTIDSDTASKIGFDNDAISNYSDSAAIINCYSSALYVQVQDTYGNLVDNLVSEPTVSFSTSQSSTGAFFTESGDSYTQISSADTTTGAVSVYYKDSAAGTVTLTASASGYTSGTWTITIAPAVSVYDSNNNLIKTYAPTSTSPTKEKTDGVHGGDYVESAISAAVTGDTVKLGNGIYEVDNVITINAKITLTSENGASYTTLKPTADSLHAIEVTTSGTAANPVIISGLTFDRLRATVEFDAAVMNAGYDYLTVQNCIFNYVIPDEAGSAQAVVWFRVGTITSATVSNNTFSNCVGFNAISGGDDRSGSIQFYDAGGGGLSGVTISGNTLTNCNDYGIVIGGSAPTHSATISNNTLTNCYSSICLSDYITSVSITGNTITGGYNYGIKVEGSHNTAITIKNNTITGCAGLAGYAILLENPTTTAANQVVQYNDIYNNASSCYAIQANADNAGIGCQYNWYGSATGPYYSALTGATISKSNPNGAGDKITDDVTYYPWLHKSRTDVVNDNASYQACTMKLVAGWNTLSTPVKLISTADSIDELIPAGMTIGYYYDATGWHLITSGYVLNPCDAVYVKMGTEKYVLLKFDASAFSAPSKALNAGWNLISLAYLGSSGQTDLATVASVYKTAAGLPGYSQLVSPSLNATQTDMYGTTRTSWAYASGQTGGTYSCYAGLGYWVYMQNAATLAGFEITPIAPDLD